MEVDESGYVDSGHNHLETIGRNGFKIDIYLISSQQNKKIKAKYTEKNQSFNTEEFKELYNLSHQNLMKFCGYDQINSVIWMDLEDFEGISLNKILEEQTKLGDQLEYGDISCFFAQLLLAVDFLHAKNIFHSFINPKVIYIQKKKLKLGGFFFCEKLNSPNDISKQPNRIIGYDAPELPNIGIKYDIWCMGCVFYDLTQADVNQKIEHYSDLCLLIVNNSIPSYSIDSANRPESDTNSETSSICKETKERRKYKLPNTYKTYKKLFKKITNQDFSKRPSAKELIMETKNYVEIHVAISHICKLNELELQSRGRVISNASSLMSSSHVNRTMGGEQSRYIIEKFLGSGQYGIVFKVKDSRNNTKCVKQIQKHLNETLMKRELEILAYINKSKEYEASETHPNILIYYEHFYDNENLNIVTEYCVNGDLEAFLRQRKLINHHFERNHLLDWSKQILCGLKYLQSLKVVHRDIKPANILITKNFTRLKFGDFGFGIQTVDTNGPIKTNCGTFRYMAPEVDKETKRNETMNQEEKLNYDIKCDVWSTGCVIYEMSTLKFAFFNEEGKIEKSIESQHYIQMPQNHLLKELVEKHMLVRSPTERSSATSCYKMIKQIINQFQ